MKIKVEGKNKAKIEAALLAVNGKAYQHTYTTFSEIERIAYIAERSLEGMEIPKSERKGAHVIAESGEVLPNSYKYSRKTTSVLIERTATGWFLVAVGADSAGSKLFQSQLTLTTAQDAIAIASLRRGYRVAPVVAEVAA